MSQSVMRRGPVLPYRPLGGVVPCAGGWLVAGAKLQGINLAVEEPRVVSSLIDVLDYRPAFEVLALAAPIGWLDAPVPGGRACDVEARRVLGARRGAAVASPPWRSLLDESDDGLRSLQGLSVTGRYLLPRVVEVAKEMQPYRQRSVFEVHPELSFHQLNGDKPLRYRKTIQAGVDERRALLDAKLPGVERLLDYRLKGASSRHLLDVAACLWTCRRIVARAVTRIPENPQWDSTGLRMEIVR